LVALTGAVLLLFLELGLPSPPPPGAGKPTSVLLRRWVKLLLWSGSALGIVLVLEASLHISSSGSHPKHLASERLLTGLVSLDIVIFAVTLLLGAKALFWTALARIREQPLRMLYLPALAAAIPWAIVHAVSNPALNNPNSMRTVFLMLLLPPEGKFVLPWSP